MTDLVDLQKATARNSCSCARRKAHTGARTECVLLTRTLVSYLTMDVRLPFLTDVNPMVFAWRTVQLATLHTS